MPIVLFVGTLLLLSACGNSPKYLEPTGKATDVPPKGTDFSTYVNRSQRKIEEVLRTVRGEGAYLKGESTAQAAAMRSPFQRFPSDQQQCQSNAAQSHRGFLLIHGLTDSPYLMKSIADSLQAAYPCALIRAVLLPGHGTVVGDTLEMQYSQWQGIIDYGIESFQEEKGRTELYLIGFSTGTSLILDYLKRHPADTHNRTDGVAGVVLLSTAIKANTKLAFLTPWLRHVKNWSSIFPERDAARYESFSLNAGAEFYLLTEHMDETDYIPNVPMLMAVSADDTTIDAKAAREFFCSAEALQRKKLIWYTSIDPAKNKEVQGNPELVCEDIIKREPRNFAPEYKTVNMAHTALPVSPLDRHYGVHGNYHHCKEYDSDTTQVDFKQCQQDNAAAVYGENKQLLESRGKLDQKYFRRGTFNPDYAFMMGAINCFVDQSCSMETLDR
nr:alpha/beta fold hydrolase [uncultured Desulfobulbus sp.]